MEKLTRIIDQEMEAVGGQKISMPTLAPDFMWKASGWFHFVYNHTVPVHAFTCICPDRQTHTHTHTHTPQKQLKRQEAVSTREIQE